MIPEHISCQKCGIWWIYSDAKNCARAFTEGRWQARNGGFYCDECANASISKTENERMKHTKWTTFDRVVLRDTDGYNLSIEDAITQHNALFDEWQKEKSVEHHFMTRDTKIAEMESVIESLSNSNFIDVLAGDSTANVIGRVRIEFFSDGHVVMVRGCKQYNFDDIGGLFESLKIVEQNMMDDYEADHTRPDAR